MASKSNTPQVVSPKPEPEPQPEPDASRVTVVWLNAISPLLIGADIDIRAAAEEMGLTVYFIVSNIDEYTENDKDGKAVFIRRAGVAKVVRNICGHALVKMREPLPELAGHFTEEAIFSLPKLPLEMVLKLDQFFRRVDDEKHTEAIVLLTYDPTVGGSDGWGVLVPKQRNSAGHCDYEPESVVDDQPDNAHIVGSVHSHPGMSAFVSHTDIGDQATFDGLHITYGWTGPKTEYYIEMQMGGGRFQLQPEDVFESPPLPEVTDDLSDWIAKVDKFATQYSSYGGYGGYTGYGEYGGYTNKSSASSNGKVTTPPGCPNIETNTVVTNWANGYERSCPVCRRNVSAMARDQRRCGYCMVFIAERDENVEDIIALRKELNNKESGPSASVASLVTPHKPIYFWHRSEAGNKIVETVSCLWSPNQTGSIPRWIEKTPAADAEVDAGAAIEAVSAQGASSVDDTIPVYLQDEWDDGDLFAPFAEARICLLCGFEKREPGANCANPQCHGANLLVPMWYLLNSTEQARTMELSRNHCILCNRPLADGDCDCRAGAFVANSSADAYGMWDLNPYAQDARCETCQHYFEATCPILRAAVRAHNEPRMLYSDAEIEHSIHGCAGYEFCIEYAEAAQDNPNTVVRNAVSQPSTDTSEVKHNG